MANHYIASYTLITNRGGAYAPSKVVNVNWNDVSEAIEVYVADDIFTGGVLQTSGPSLGLLNVDYFQTNYNYNFCDGTTFNYFTLTSHIFPYAQQEFIADSFACAVTPSPTCDLQIADNPITTEASNAATNDGSLTVSATSSNGVIKFALFDFDYATEGQTSGLFEDLYGSEYTVYAKDELGCVDTVTVNVPISEVYNLRYFMEFTDMHGNGNGFNHKIEIYERGYVGDDEELLAAGDPYTKKLNSDAEDRFFIIRATDITFKFVSQVSFQYHDLFTEDERQFLVKHYIDYGSGYELDWSGYIVPFLYSEDYVNPVYNITVIATDGLATLKDLDFVNDSDNNLTGMMSGIKIISMILNKLDLSLNIRSGLNMYDVDFDSAATDDPLAQAYYDTSVYYDKDGNAEKCDVVLKNILVDYLAVIAQSDNKWIIWRPEELISDFDYREFDSNGDYTSNGNINPLVVLDTPQGTTDRIAWKDRSATLAMLPSYGKFIINQHLIPRESLFLSYSFEPEDVVPYIGGTFFFYGWAIIIDQGTGITWGMQKVSRDFSKGALYIQWSPPQVSDLTRKQVTFYTLQCKCNLETYDDLMRFAFDYNIESGTQYPFVKMQYKLVVVGATTWYHAPEFGNNNVWSPTDVGYVDIYVNRYNTWNTFEVSMMPPNATPGYGDLEINLYIRLNNGGDSDYSSEANVKAITTTGLTTGYKITATASDGLRHFYELIDSTEADDPPNVLRPTDYNGTTNKKVWDSIGTSNQGFGTGTQYIDNVVFEILPNREKTPENIEFIVNSNPGNKRELVIDTFHGDYPQTIPNGKFAYKNIIQRFETIEYIGTTAWARDGFAESNVIQKIMLKTLIAQSRKASRRLTGSVVGDIYLKPYNVVDDQSQDGRKYLVQGFDQQGRINEYNIDLYEIKNVADEDGGGSAFSGAYNPPEFGAQFDTGA